MRKQLYKDNSAIKGYSTNDIIPLNSYYIKRHSQSENVFFVGILGLEPRMTGPESVVLPLHHIPITLTVI